MKFGKYEVSETGEVRDTVLDLPVEKFMTNSGKVCVRLFKDGHYKVYEIKRLMAEAYGIVRNKGDYVYFEGGELNVKNLRCVTKEEYFRLQKKKIVMIYPEGEVEFNNLTDAATYLLSIDAASGDIVTIGMRIKSVINKDKSLFGYKWSKR